MNYGQWPAYVSVAERRAKAEKAAAKAKKAGIVLTPITAFRGAIAKTFWGKAWCDNLEHYSDYASRLPRGRTYVRNGSVIDLQITPGEVRAQVMGSSLYKVTASVTAVPEKQWQTICADCSGSIDSLVELLQGKLSNAVMERICKPGSGLFPSPKEIRFNCDCPDSASMCKHVAAVLYGIGARLDQQPEVLFTLRRVDAKDLVSQASRGLPAASKRPATGKVLDDAQLAAMFGIEMADVSAPAKPAVKKTSAASRKTPAAAKTPASKKSASGKMAVKSPAKPRQSASSKVAAPATKKAASPPATPKPRKVATNSACARPVKDKTG
ncbi:SWIM zinc finger family protein [Polaromonas naphthalenivorans]|uniref:Zinc finger, SWIM-type n=1 Tax=Polaromonas naphthalenivorans (strain CJ2) TaxID=365044 RepID=A1VL84_POLNA|nr:hypothetical protein [Polaromonas naphthalenivorans]ABM36412.1 zinc finger, SWIM-type [Polaromonas naphthalenivorans CJ2]